MDTPRHRRQMNLLIESLVLARPEREDMFVGGDMFVWYSELQTKRAKDVRGPDVFVVLGAIPERERKRKSWVVWEEGGRLPDVVIELTSPSTEHIDRGEKKHIYERIWRLPEYYLFDPETKALEGWRLTDGRYTPIEADAVGQLECRALGLRLGVREGVFQQDHTEWLRWIDPSTGATLPTAHEIALAAQARAQDAQTRALEAQARARDAQARADEAEAHAAHERSRADALAEELAALKRRSSHET